MKILAFTILSFLAILFANAQTLNYPQTRTVDVSDYYFDTIIPDPYRWLENMKSEEVKDWLKKQSDFSDDYLKKIPGRDNLFKRVKEISEMQGDIIVNAHKGVSNNYYIKYPKGENFPNLYRIDPTTNKEEILFDIQKYKKGASIYSYSINRKEDMIALKIQDEGSEICEIIFMKLPELTILPEKLYPIWSEFNFDFSPDSKSVIYTQLSTSDPNAEDIFKNMKVKLHTIGTNPNNDKTILSSIDNPELNILSERLPIGYFSNDGKYLFLKLTSASYKLNGAFYTEVENIYNNKVELKQLLKEEDMINDFYNMGDQLFFFTSKDAPNYKIGVTSIKEPDFDHAIVIVPNGDEAIFDMKATRNYLFFEKSNGITQNLYRINPKTFDIDKIDAPEGVNFGYTLNPIESDHIAIRNSSWISPINYMELDLSKSTLPQKSSWINTNHDLPDFTKIYETKELEVPGYDGEMIPLSIIYSKNIKLDGSTPCIMIGYGMYGYKFVPEFIGELAAFLQHGGMIAVAHVRGGGEKGEAWHLAGMKKTKPNTWKDFISCAEYLISENYTSPQKLIGWGSSAGGILIGRAITERPDLFAVAINIVGMTQALRNETTANGDNQIPELGSIKNKDDIEAIIEMDVQSKINNGVKYPAVLTSTGINDSRVVPWMPAKFVAALQQGSTSNKPVFLSVDYKSGHVISDLESFYNLFADILAFSLWQTGEPSFQLNY